MRALLLRAKDIEDQVPTALLRQRVSRELRLESAMKSFARHLSRFGLLRLALRLSDGVDFRTTGHGAYYRLYFAIL